jgi:hypothetical protein
VGAGLPIAKRHWALRISLFACTIIAVLAGHSVHAFGKPAQERLAGEKQRIAKRYFVDFHARSRPSISGHIFIVYGRLNSDGRIAKAQVVGFSPDSDRNWASYFLPLPGLLGRGGADLKEHSVVVYRRHLSAAEFNRMNAKLRQLKAARPSWHFIFFNCNDFVTDIARSIGLYRPHSLLPPIIYVTLLQALNGD